MDGPPSLNITPHSQMSLLCARSVCLTIVYAQGLCDVQARGTLNEHDRLYAANVEILSFRKYCALLVVVVAAAVFGQIFG
jgi:hypothetical protein